MKPILFWLLLVTAVTLPVMLSACQLPVCSLQC